MAYYVTTKRSVALPCVVDVIKNIVLLFPNEGQSSKYDNGGALETLPNSFNCTSLEVQCCLR